jgi:hypothetical protein
MARLERPFAVRVARILDQQAQEVAKAIREQGPNINYAPIVDRFNEDLTDIFEQQYRQTITVFGDRILNSLKSVEGYQTKAGDVFAEQAEFWIKNEAAEMVTAVGNTTKKKIGQAIEFGFSESMTGAAVANEIVSRTGGAIAKQRAITISRTETHKAASFGSQAAAESTGIPMKKVWISAEDERTRETHLEADSTYHADPIALKESFIVGGDSMIQPGMGSDPAESVNCRCVVGYVTD